MHAPPLTAVGRSRYEECVTSVYEECVESIEDAGASAERPILRSGGIALDLRLRTVDRGTGPVALTAREFHLMRFFMLHAGRPCSREQLLAEVWDTPFDPGTNVVDVCVHRLRHKLGHGSIETLRNVGYLLDAA